MNKLFSLLLAISALVLAGCQGDDTASDQESGEVFLALTDAEGTFLSYQVQINSINLVNQRDQAVSVLSHSTQVDFAQYVDLTELVTAATAPAGQYNVVELNVEFLPDGIIVQQDDGSGQVAQPVDQDGKPLSDFTLTLALNQPLVVAPGVPAHLTIDFDLDASNQVDEARTEVIVDPILVGMVEMVEERDHRLRGLLQTVNTDTQTLQLDLRPFRLREGNFGSLSVSTDANTSYQIDDTLLTGEAGMAQLAAADSNSPIVIQATFFAETSTLVANQVLFGSAVPWADDDVLKGVVTKREGNQIWLHGAVLELVDSQISIPEVVAVTMDDALVITKERQQLSSNQAVSVGSRVRILGEFDSQTDNLTATHLRLLPNRLVGHVESVANELVTDVKNLNRRRNSVYDMTGTGITTELDSELTSYEIDYGTLDVANLEIDDRLIVRGYVADFGAAPDDFAATSIRETSVFDIADRIYFDYLLNEDYALTFDQESNLIVVTAASLPFNLDHLKTAQSRSVLEDGSSWTMIASEGWYSIKDRGNKSLSVYKDFQSFKEALEVRTSEGAKIKSIYGAGRLEENNRFTAARIAIAIR